MDADSAEPASTAAAAAAQPPLELEAVDVDTDDVDADAVHVQESAPLASASLASATLLLAAWLQALLSVLQHVSTCGSCSCLLCCCVTVCAFFAAVESSKNPKTLNDLTCSVCASCRSWKQHSRLYDQCADALAAVLTVISTSTVKLD